MAGRCPFQRTNISCGLPSRLVLPWFAPGNAVCTELVCVSFGGQKSAAGAFVLATGATGSYVLRLCYRLRLRFHGCLRFFRFNHRLLTSWACSGRTFSGLRFRRVTRCIAIAQQVRQSRVQSARNRPPHCSAVADFCGWVSALFRSPCTSTRC